MDVEDEQIREEVKQIEQQGKTEERKFKSIKNTTSITSILDMEPYWRYLMQNKTSLEHTVGNCQRQIEELTRERETAKRELASLVVEPEESSFLSSQEIEFMQEHLSAKIKELESSESHLAHLDELLISVTNSVSLIAFDVMKKSDEQDGKNKSDEQDGKNKSDELDVKPSNASSYLEYCTNILESMLTSVAEDQFSMGRDPASDEAESPVDKVKLLKTYSEQTLLSSSDRQRKSLKFLRRTSIPEVY